MVKPPLTTPADPARDLAAVERRIVLSYAPAAGRAGLAALLALDDLLADIVRTTRDPMVGQMRLTWWHGALTALDSAAPPAQPVLRDLAALVLPGVSGAALAVMVEGWEVLLEGDEADPAARAALHATARGRTLFEAAATVLGGDLANVGSAGEGWAAAELAARSREPTLAAAADRLATDRLAGFPTTRWPHALRPLGAMALLARDRTRAPARRFGRILYHRLAGL
ncbi:squalene/phytoene synthase family protein [Sphingomonas sp. RS2018]